MGAIGFFERIFKELQQNIYIALGGSLEDQTLDWTQRGLHFADIAIKILILLAFIGFYWLLVLAFGLCYQAFQTPVSAV